MENVGVFFGGQSVESEISIITGVTAVNALKASKYTPIPIFVDRQGVFYTGEDLFDISNYKNLNFDRLEKVTFIAGSKWIYLIKGKKFKPLAVLSAVVNCIHGQPGEDGAISGLMELCDLPCASPNMVASSVCMDKVATKTFLKGGGIKALPYVCVSTPEEYLHNEKFGYPIIVKPSKLGSSIGISKAENPKQAHDGINLALRYGDQALIEPFIKQFIEINCAVYMGVDGKIVVSECEQPVGKAELLTFEDKYKSGKRVFPADIPKSLSEKVKRITKKVYSLLNTNGVIRIDYMIIDGEVYLNEINTVPGSLAYYLFAKTLKEFSVMLTELIQVAIKNSAKEKTFVKEFKSEILKGGAKGGKMLVK